jgi:hypothetical protein
MRLELSGVIVEGPLTELDTMRGGIKLVCFTGSIAAMYADQVHPSFINLKAGQGVSYCYETADTPVQVQLAKGESHGTEYYRT